MAFAGAVAGGLVAFAVARTAAREPVQRFVGRRPRLIRVHALLERRGFAAILGQGLGSGSITTVLIAAGSVLLGGASTAILVRHIRRTDAAPA